MYHPEIQAELEFGLAQDGDRKTLIDNFNAFWNYTEDWGSAEEQIRVYRDKCSKEKSIFASEFENTLADELAYFENLWNGKYVSALNSALSVVSKIKSTELKGYRGLWLYNASIAAYFESKNNPSLYARFCELRQRASKCVTNVEWMQIDNASSSSSNHQSIAHVQVENIEQFIEKHGLVGSGKYEKEANEIKKGLYSSDSKEFEDAHKRLGDLLGYNAYKIESEGSPDPYWIIGNDYCIVFEDHFKTEDDSKVSVKKAF